MKYEELAKEILENNWFVGVRSLCDDEQYDLEDSCRDSYEWDLENDCSTYFTTGETANGTCATYIDTDVSVDELATNIEAAIELNKRYGNSRQAIIAGHSVNNDGYFDNNEVRIIGAFVLALV